MKSMIVRTCILLPFSMVGGYFLLAFVGIIASMMGAQEAFYCGFFCKFSVGFMLMLGAAVVFFQARKYYNECHSKEN